MSSEGRQRASRRPSLSDTDSACFLALNVSYFLYRNDMSIYLLQYFFMSCLTPAFFLV